MDELLGSDRMLSAVAEELESAVAELQRCRDAHRQTESLLLAVLDKLPVSLLVVDESRRIRAASTHAHEQWEVELDRPFHAFHVPDAVRAVIESTLAGGQRSSVSGAGAAALEHGDGDRYVIGWEAPPAA